MNKIQTKPWNKISNILNFNYEEYIIVSCTSLFIIEYSHDLERYDWSEYSDTFKHIFHYISLNSLNETNLYKIC